MIWGDNYWRFVLDKSSNNIPTMYEFWTNNGVWKLNVFTGDTGRGLPTTDKDGNHSTNRNIRSHSNSNIGAAQPISEYTVHHEVL